LIIKYGVTTLSMALNSLVAMTEPAFVSSKKFKQTYFFAMRKVPS
jgi:hypothetical protein